MLLLGFFHILTKILVDKNYGRTTTTLLSHTASYQGMITVGNVDENCIIVKAQGGALYTLKGAMMCMKNLVLSWKPPAEIEDWKIEHFAPVFMMHPKTFLGEFQLIQKLN